MGRILRGKDAVNGETSQIPKLTVVSDLSTLPDEELMMRYRDGDRPAFDILVRRHRNRLINFLFRMTSNRQLAEEVQAETWLKMHRAASRYEPRAKFTTFLFTAAYRQCLTTLDSKAHKVKAATVDVSVQDLSPRLLSAGAPPTAPNPERQAILDEQIRRLHEEVSELPEAHRAAFLLYYVEGLSCMRVGEVLGLTSKEVKGRLAYARRLLRERVVA